MVKTKTVQVTTSNREKALRDAEEELRRCRAEPELSFLFTTMTGLTELKTIGTTSPIKQLMIACGILDHLFEEGHRDLGTALIALGEALARALADNPEATGDRTVKIIPAERKLN